ncbi:hypothetical protein, partial [Burkholderia cenocepacia]|uniref:hypothetical protein n=4 Tax=Burkholderia cenocepacia TaxID=95486 RepID=UPI00195540A3
MRRKTPVHGCPCGGVSCRRCEQAPPANTARDRYRDRTGWPDARRRPVPASQRRTDFDAGIEHDGCSDRIGRADRGRQIR